jgi:NhaA family Na+:H+ antiporter
MFGTLVVVLPSVHGGGELIIRHGTREVSVNLSSPDVSELRFAAFYADCEHEVRPITHGSRVCLTYNLSLADKRKKKQHAALTAPLYEGEVAAAAEILRATFRERGAPMKIFLVALAIVDDLGALLVIAAVYTASINWSGLVVAALFLAALFVANRVGARRAPIYLALGTGAWYGLLMSGVHATLAGVVAALFVPARVRIVPDALAGVIRRSADAIDDRTANGVRDAMDPERFATISVLSRTLDAANSPIQRFEYMVHPWVAFGILPVFALFNAGVEIDASAIRTLASPVPLGIIAGLVIGKPAGICLASWLAVRTGLATLPDGVSWRHVYGTAWLAGIGFTMALFISGLAFPDTGLESQAKLGILLGSLVSAVAGIAVLLTTSDAR